MMSDQPPPPPPPPKNLKIEPAVDNPVYNAYVMVHFQAANLLQADKKLKEDAQSVFATCSKLNSRQISTILRHCSVAEGEHAVSAGFSEEMVRLAKLHTDEPLLSTGMELNLEEDPNLELKFHIPQQGYSSDTVWGIPPGLQDYLDPFISAG